MSRIGDRATFAALRRDGRSATSGGVRITRLPDGRPPRVAFAISRAHGNAVTRNRLRRRLRALCAELDLESGAYLVSARPGVVEHTFDVLRRDLQSAAQRVMERS